MVTWIMSALIIKDSSNTLSCEPLTCNNFYHHSIFKLSFSGDIETDIGLKVVTPFVHDVEKCSNLL